MSIITVTSTKEFKEEIFRIFDKVNIGIKTFSDEGNLTVARLITYKELDHNTICELVNLCKRYCLKMNIKRSGAGLRIQFEINEG